MPERMTNVEYGDVLSSIRRLVGEEGAGPAPIAAGARPLVLTEAHRVPEDDAPAAPFVEISEEGGGPAWPRIVAMPAPSRAGSMPHGEASVEAEALASLLAADAAEACATDAGATEIVVDEARLREILREMIRQELQGPMGERITRNIRKLVRAEIHRAILTRDLD